MLAESAPDADGFCAAARGYGARMKALRLLNPFRIREIVARVREASGGGGPVALRLTGIGRPEGWLVPTSRVELEVKARDGSVTRFAPELPIPFPYAWGYRIARHLGVPLVSEFDSEKLNVEVPVPRRS